MNQIWTNPSLQRSLVLANGTTSNLIYCLKLSQKDIQSDTIKDTIILPGMEYVFTFYDASSGKLYSITGLVVDIYEDQIKIKYINNTNNNSSNYCSSRISIAKGIKNCNCISNPPDVSKYEGPSIVFIPIMNIVSISMITQNPNNKYENNGGIHIMLLGISATTIKAIIVRMAFFDDSVEEAVKYVDLEAGNIYDLTYESVVDNTIYESRVKVISIEEIDDNIPCKPGKGYVREHVGYNNSVYIDCCKKDEFMKNPPVKKIKIIVDTSESFSGRYEAIMLDTIRDCVLIDESSDETEVDTNISNSYCDCCNFKTNNCHPKYCGHYIPMIPNDNHCGCNASKTYVYNYENMYKAVVTGDKVSVTVNGETTNMNLDTLLKYYLGID